MSDYDHHINSACNIHREEIKKRDATIIRLQMDLIDEKKKSALVLSLQHDILGLERNRKECLAEHAIMSGQKRKAEDELSECKKELKRCYEHQDYQTEYSVKTQEFMKAPRLSIE